MTRRARPGFAHRLLAAILPAFLIAGPGAEGAQATPLSWKTAVSGSAGVAANWIPAQIPTAADDPTFEVAGAYTVTFDASVPSTRNHVYRAGAVTLSVTSPHVIAQALRVGDQSPDVGALTLSIGSLTSTTTLTVGNLAGSTGALTVDGPHSLLVTSAAGSDVVVGASGGGSLNVTGGGRVTAADDVLIGDAAGGTGAATVAGLVLIPIARSTIRASGTTGDIVVGNNGNGTLGVQTGGQAVASRDVRIAPSAGVTGTVTVQGASGGFSAGMTVGGGLDVARNDVAGSAAGTGEIQILDAGRVAVTGATRVGDPDGGTGTLSIGASSQLTTGSLVVDDAHGVLDLQGGLVTVDGGAFDPPGVTLDLDSADPSGVFLQNGATAGFDGGSPSGNALIVGDSRFGELDVLSGSHLTIANGHLAVGRQAGGSGTLKVTGGSTLGDVGTLDVGVAGTGTLQVLTGARVDMSDLTMGYASGGVGTVTVTGAGSQLNLQGLDLGGHGGAPGGGGTLTVGDGGAVSLSGGGSALRILKANALLQVNAGGTVAVAGGADHRGHIAMAGGALDAGLLDFAPGATLTGYGTVSARILADNPDNVISASGGALTLGSAGAADGFVNLGSLETGAATVGLLDADAAELGNVTLDLGTLNLPPLGGSLQAGKTLGGRGTVNGDVANAGTIAAGSDGLSFSGRVLGVGQGITGGKITFLSGGGFTGAGTLGTATLLSNAGSVLTATGALTLGASSGSTVALGGTLLVGANAVTLRHTTGGPAALGSDTQLAGGSLTSASGLALGSGGLLEGSGDLVGALTNGGSLSPGLGSAGTLTVAGAYTQSAAGHLVMEIGDAPSNQFDRLSISGAAALDGALDVRLLGSLIPQPGQDFALLTYGSHTGTFSSVSFQGQPVGGQFTLTYGATSLVLHVNALTTDVPPPGPQPPLELALAGHSGPWADAGFALSVPAAAQVTLELFDPRGRRVATLYRGAEPAGRFRYLLRDPGTGLPGGVYFGRAHVSIAGAASVLNARVVLVR